MIARSRVTLAVITVLAATGCGILGGPGARRARDARRARRGQPRRRRGGARAGPSAAGCPPRRRAPGRHRPAARRRRRPPLRFRRRRMSARLGATGTSSASSTFPSRTCPTGCGCPEGSLAHAVILSRGQGPSARARRAPAGSRCPEALTVRLGPRAPGGSSSCTRPDAQRPAARQRFTAFRPLVGTHAPTWDLQLTTNAPPRPGWPSGRPASSR